MDQSKVGPAVMDVEMPLEQERQGLSPTLEAGKTFEISVGFKEMEYIAEPDESNVGVTLDVSRAPMDMELKPYLGDDSVLPQVQMKKEEGPAALEAGKVPEASARFKLMESIAEPDDSSLGTVQDASQAPPGPDAKPFVPDETLERINPEAPVGEDKVIGTAQDVQTGEIGPALQPANADEQDPFKARDRLADRGYFSLIE